MPDSSRALTAGDALALLDEGLAKRFDSVLLDLFRLPGLRLDDLRTALDRLGPHRDAALVRRDPLGQNALMLAARHASGEHVRLLLEASAGRTSPQALEADVQGHTALMHAVLARSPDSVAHLLEVSSPQATNANGMTALMLAAQTADVRLVNALLPGVRPRTLNAQAQGGFTVLMLAARAGRAEAVAALQAAGADSSLRTPKGETALHLAAFAGQAECVALLAREAARRTETTRAGHTPLDLALREHNLPAAAVLIARLPSGDVVAALDRAVRHDPGVYSGSVDVQDLVNPRTVWGGDRALDLVDVRLRQAAERADLDGVRQALADGADPNRGETLHRRMGLTALALACLGDTLLDNAPPRTAQGPDVPDPVLEVVRALLAAGANPDGVGASTTPLLAACQDNRWEVVVALLEAGASPDLYAGAPEAPVGIARQRLTLLHRFLRHEADAAHPGPRRTPAQRLAVVNALLAAGVDPDARYDDDQQARQGVSALLMAVEARFDDLSLVTRLLDAGARVDPLTTWRVTEPAMNARLLATTDDRWVETRWSPLMAAAASGQMDLCRLLVDRGADLRQRLDQAITPLQCRDPLRTDARPDARPLTGTGPSVIEVLRDGGWPTVAAYLEDRALRQTLADVWGTTADALRGRPRL